MLAILFSLKTMELLQNGVATHFGAIHCYCPQPSCGKVMFLHLCVILFTVEGGLCPSMPHRSHDQGESVGGGVSVREIPQTETPSYGNERAVRILLECILVFNENSIAKL